MPFVKGMRPPKKGERLVPPPDPDSPAVMDHVVRKAKWESLKDEFLSLAADGKDVHWPSLAAKYGFSAQSARNKASTQKWYAEIEERRKAREDLIEDKLAHRTSLALDKLNDNFATNEAAIRTRHATMARGLQVRAITRLKELPLSAFTARDALTMLRMGMEEERFALGMKETADPVNDSPKSNEYSPIMEQMGGHKKVAQIGMTLLKALQSVELDDLAEGAPEPVEAEQSLQAASTSPSGYAPVPGPVIEVTATVIPEPIATGPKKIIFKKKPSDQVA